jgi:quinoprotein glucose dehydrogenase
MGAACGYCAGQAWAGQDSVSQALVSQALAGQATSGWTVYNGGLDGDHYSPLKQIDRGNVARLEEAWRFDTGETGGIQDNPLVVGRTLYAYTPTEKIVALDAATGKLKWTFDSGIVGTQPARGMTWWQDGPESHHAGRVFAGVLNFLYCLDAETGKPVASFGEGGRVDLRKGLERGPGVEEDYRKNSIVLTTPGVLYKDMILVGGRNPETHPAPPGDIRAFDVRTGKLRWSFHTIPRPGEAGYETWPAEAWKTAGAANNWAGMALDAERGIVYAPTGSAVFDFYGGDRLGNDLYANTLLALDANTGKRLWHFQGVHHDIWDRDFPSEPALFTVKREGKTVPALAQTTKQGYLYLFDRVTGNALFPIHEEPYQASTLPGEAASPTQPKPELPEPFARQRLTAEMLTTRTPAAHDFALKAFEAAHSEGQFVPFALGKLTVVFPGFDGGAEWGGPAIDPERDVLYVNATEMAWLGGLVPTERGGSAGRQVYQAQCAVCHGPERKGAPPAFPSLGDVMSRLTAEQVAATVKKGKGRMPSFPGIDDAGMKELVAYLRTGDEGGVKTEPRTADAGADAGGEYKLERYTFTGYKKFLDEDGYPAIAPPWGTLNAIDLKSGKSLWKVPLGYYPELAKQGMDKTGTENYGGPVVTAGGVLFIGATIYDRKLRAFDTRDGKLLWETELPYSGVATPATYMVDGRQYVVIGTSGARDAKGPQGGAYVAFALPR